MRGAGVTLWDDAGRAYLDFASGIAVNALGYGDAGIARAMQESLATGLVHVSNLFRTEPGEAGERTVITYRAHFRFKGVYRLVEPFLRKGFEPIADDTVIQLKRTLESVI